MTLKNKLSQFAFLWLLCFSSALIADNNSRTFGFGLGPLYSGLGVNIGFTDQRRVHYLSLGCLGFGSSEEVHSSDGVVTARERSFSSNCGVGAGFLSALNDHHGWGVGLGMTYHRRNDGEENGMEYHLNAAHHYFFRGIERLGWHLGVAPGVTYQQSVDRSYVDLQISLGYQF